MRININERKAYTMTKDKALKAIKAAQQSGDTEAAHCEADNALCEFLKHLGHGDLVDEYHEVDKWFA